MTKNLQYVSQFYTLTWFILRMRFTQEKLLQNKYRKLWYLEKDSLLIFSTANGPNWGRMSDNNQKYFERMYIFKMKDCSLSAFRMNIFLGLDLPSFFYTLVHPLLLFFKNVKNTKKNYKIPPKKESYAQIEWLTSITLLGSFSHTPSLVSCVWYIFTEYDHK